MDSFQDKHEMVLDPTLPERINKYIHANSSYIQMDFFLKLFAVLGSDNRSWGSSGPTGA